MNGVSSNIFAGQFCKSGTNSFEILIDEEKLMEVLNNDYIMNDELNVKGENIENMMNELYNKEDYSNVNETDFNFGFGIENKKEFMLGQSGDFKLTIDDKVLNNINENIDNIELEDVVFNEDNIDKLELEDIATENIKTEEVDEEETKNKTKGKKNKKENKTKEKKSKK